MSKKTKDLASMTPAQRTARLQELKMELVKASIRGQKTSMKTKEIKKAIARIFTFNRAESAKRLKTN